jgi:hypothetical protein
MAPSIKIKHPIGTGATPAEITTKTGSVVVQGTAQVVDPRKSKLKFEVLDDKKKPLSTPPKVVCLHETPRRFAFLVLKLPASGGSNPPYYWVKVSDTKDATVLDEQAVKIIVPTKAVQITSPLSGAEVYPSFTAWGDVDAAGNPPKCWVDSAWDTFVGTLTYWDGDTCAFSFTDLSPTAYDLSLSQLTDGNLSTDMQSPVTVVAS